ncbi:MAG: RluA family pseudouridine synthase [Oscillospiraceae bacterium]|jgi:23S rRNA pseudouridine955/2504/2580 synthase|nr:RluA family pseudouridine synthase [Oscillospiraceae bacterium]
MKEFSVGKNDGGARLDRFVSKCVPLLPPSLAQKYIRLGRIKVGGRKAPRDTRLAPGDTVQMYVNDEFFSEAREDAAYLRVTDPGLDIVYEDANILLVNKPAGVLCHSGGGFDYATLIARIQAYLYARREWNPRGENSFAPALCNRIDRNTQGIVIAAKTAETLRIVNEKIKTREIDKYYLAVAEGEPRPKSGELRGYLFKDAVKNMVFVSDEPRRGAQLAVTEYKTLASKSGLSLLECRLHTGRTHQIRAQLAHIGCPILGDGKYGSEKSRRKYGESGQLLCSYKLTFSFRSDAGALGYLNGKTCALGSVGFADKYFPGISYSSVTVFPEFDTVI